tara:strand:- start:6384 stop:6983 length:600 start_codon:yes stop_codon:yes gene_type:complete
MRETETINKKGHKVVKYLTHTEALKIIDAARALKTRKQFSGNLVSLAIQLQYYGGLRVSELTSVTPRDIKIEDSRLDVLVKGKGNKQRVVPIVNQSLIATINYINNDGIDFDKPYIDKDRRTVWRWYKAVEVKTGIYLNTHIFRHSFARNLLQIGIPINTVSLLLGHSFLSTTVNSYLQLSPNVSELEKAWELLSKGEN